MIKTLEERLAERKESYLKHRTSEYQAQKFMDQFPQGFFTERDCLSVYDDSAYFYLYPSTIEIAELDVIPAISAIFGNHWTKTVERQEVTYHIYWHKSDYSISVRVTPRIEGTCRIIAQATGKMKKKTKYVEVEEPEVEYIVDCGEGENDEMQAV